MAAGDTESGVKNQGAEAGKLEGSGTNSSTKNPFDVAADTLGGMGSAHKAVSELANASDLGSVGQSNSDLDPRSASILAGPRETTADRDIIAEDAALNGSSQAAVEATQRQRLSVKDSQPLAQKRETLPGPQYTLSAEEQAALDNIHTPLTDAPHQPSMLRTAINNRTNSPVQPGPTFTMTSQQQAELDNIPPGPLDTRTVPRQPSLAESGINKVRGLFRRRGEDQSTATDTTTVPAATTETPTTATVLTGAETTTDNAPIAPSGETADVNPVASPLNTPVEGGVPVQGVRKHRRLGQFGNPAAETTTPPPEAAPNNESTVVPPTETPAPRDAASTEDTEAVKETSAPTTTPDAGTVPVTEAPPVVAAEDGATAEPSTNDNEAGNATTSDTSPSPATTQPQLVEDLDQGISLDSNTIQTAPAGGPTPAPEAASVVAPADSEPGTVTAAKSALGEIRGSRRLTQRERRGQAARPQTTPLVDRGTPEARQAHAEAVARNDVTPTLQDRVKAGEITQLQADQLLAENRTNYPLNAQRLVTLQNSTDQDVLSRQEYDPSLKRPVATIEEARQLRQREIDDLKNKTRAEFRPPGSPEARAAQPVDEAQRQEARQRLDKEIADLTEASKQGPLSAEQTSRLTTALGERSALGQSPEARRQRVLEELKAGQPMTEERKAVLMGKEDEDIPDVETRTPVEIAAARKAELQGLEDQAYEQMSKGEDATETMIDYQKKMAEQQGFTYSDAQEKYDRNLMQGIFNGVAVEGQEIGRMKAIREKFTELGKQMMLIKQLKRLVEERNKNEDALKTAVNKAEGEWVRESEDNVAEKQRKYNLWQYTSQRLAQYQTSTEEVKKQGREAREKSLQLRGWIHRKLGTHGVLYNMAFGARTLGVIAANNATDIFEATAGNFA